MNNRFSKLLSTGEKLWTGNLTQSRISRVLSASILWAKRRSIRFALKQQLLIGMACKHCLLLISLGGEDQCSRLKCNLRSSHQGLIVSYWLSWLDQGLSELQLFVQSPLTTFGACWASYLSCRQHQAMASSTEVRLWCTHTILWRGDFLVWL